MNPADLDSVGNAIGATHAETAILENVDDAERILGPLRDIDAFMQKAVENTQACSSSRSSGMKQQVANRAFSQNYVLDNSSNDDPLSVNPAELDSVGNADDGIVRTTAKPLANPAELDLVGSAETGGLSGVRAPSGRS